MMPHDTSAKGRPSREVREERARAFWQAQINEGRARAAEQQARTNKPAAPRQDPPPSPPPARVPLHVVSADTEFTDTTPPVDSRRHTGSLSRSDICPSPDQRRHVGRPPLLGRSTGQRPGRLAAGTARSPSLTDSRSRGVAPGCAPRFSKPAPIATLSTAGTIPGCSRHPSQSLRKSPDTLLAPSRTSGVTLSHPPITRYPRMHGSYLSSAAPWLARLTEIRPLIAAHATSFTLWCGSLDCSCPSGHTPRHS